MSYNRGVTIEVVSYKPPKAIDASHFDLADALLSGRREVIPPDHKVGLTPVGLQPEYVLRTKSAKGVMEDTVGEVVIEPGAKDCIRVDAENPLIPFAKHIGGSIWDLHRLVLYYPSDGVWDVMAAQKALQDQFEKMVLAGVEREVEVER